jgi:hypothetical protein
MEHVPDVPAWVVVLKFPLHLVEVLKQGEYRHVGILMSDFDFIPTTHHETERRFCYTSLNCRGVSQVDRLEAEERAATDADK